MSNFGSPTPPPELQHREPPPTPVSIPTAAPWEQPPPGAVPFISQERAQLTGDALVDVTQSFAQIVTPEHFVGVIRELSFQINDLVVTSDIEFALRFNQGSVQGYAFDVFPKSAAHDLIEYDPNVTMIRIPLEAVIDVLARIRAGDIGIYLMGTTIKGWWYAEDLDALWLKYGGQS